MIYFFISFLIGAANAVNRMLNVKAGRVFGTVNGALINYFEATFLALALVFMTGSGAQLLPGHLQTVPVWAYLGGVCGLLAMVMIIIATPKTNVIISSLLGLAGNLGAAMVMDWFFFEGSFNLLKLLGIWFVLCGATWIEWSKKTQFKSFVKKINAFFREKQSISKRPSKRKR